MSYRTGTRLLTLLPLACLLAACGPDYSPNTYMSNSVQQANKVDSGVVIGVRQVKISADATLSSATGGAAGGIAGSQAGTGAVSALTALGGAVAGGLVGNAVGHNVEDTYGYEYIVRKPKGDLVSVTQKDDKPLKVGQHVLIIQGAQARLVADYTEHVDVEHADTDLAAPPKKAQSPNEPKPDLSKPVAAEKSAPPPSDGEAPAAAATIETAPVTEIAPATAAETAPAAAPVAEQPAADPAKPAATPPASAPQPGAQPSAPSATPPATVQAAPAANSATTSPSTEDKAPDAPKDDVKAPATETAPVTHGPGAAH